MNRSIPAPPSPVPPALSSRAWTAALTVLTAPPATVLALAGRLWVAEGTTSSQLTKGTTMWAASALLLAIGPILAPGPGRRRRLLAAIGLAAGWFVIGRFALSR